jgi:hypothetical protein
MIEDVTVGNELDESNEGSDIEVGGKPVGPMRALRLHCLWCCNGSSHEVSLCPAKCCPFWPSRLGHRPTAEDKAAVVGTRLYPFERPATGAEFHGSGGSALKAIRRRCIDCSGGSQVAANACATSDCDLHPFRKGKNPNRVITEERRAEMAKALAARLGRKPGSFGE